MINGVMVNIRIYYVYYKIDFYYVVCLLRNNKLPGGLANILNRNCWESQVII